MVQSGITKYFLQVNENSFSHPNLTHILDEQLYSPYLRLIGGLMKILEKITNSMPSIEEKAFVCWMCGQEHNNPTAYLWHIKACDLETASKARSTAPVMVIIQK